MSTSTFSANRPGHEFLIPQSLGERLRELRTQKGLPSRKVAPAAEMDSATLCKIEKGKRLPTQTQLAALAAFFEVPLAPLESRRIAEEMRKRYGAYAEFQQATSILREEAGEYRVSNVLAVANNPASPVNRDEIVS